MRELGMEVPERANPSLLALLAPKWITMRARAAANRRGHGFRIFFLAVLGLAFCGFAFIEMYKLLVHFRSTSSLQPASRAAATASPISSDVASPVEMITGLPVADTRRMRARSTFSNEAIL